MVLSASCLNPQFSGADFANVCISVVHFFVVEIICSLKFILLSIVIPRYLMLLTCSRGLMCVYVCVHVRVCEYARIMCILLKN